MSITHAASTERNFGDCDRLLFRSRDISCNGKSHWKISLRSLSFYARGVLPVWGKRIVLINKYCSKYLNVRNAGGKCSYWKNKTKKKHSTMRRAIGNKVYWVILFMERKIKVLVSGNRLLLTSRWGGRSFVNMLLQAFRGRDGFAFGGGVKEIPLFTVLSTSEWSSWVMSSMGGFLLLKGLPLLEAKSWIFLYS